VQDSGSLPRYISGILLKWPPHPTVIPSQLILGILYPISQMLSEQHPSHESPLRTSTITEGKESLPEGRPSTTAGQANSGLYSRRQRQGSNGAAMEEGCGQTNGTPPVHILLPPNRYRAFKQGSINLAWGVLRLLIFVVSVNQLDFVRRSLADTQVKDNDGVLSTDIEEWRNFSKEYAKKIKHVNFSVSLRTLHINSDRLLI